jgi:RNA polymerase sigma-70 factor (ECF subfamily)
MADRRTDTGQRAAEDRLDGELLARIAGGDRQALTQLYERYYHSLLRFMHRLTGDLGSAQEGVNDVMLVVWERAGAFGGRSRVATWILGIAYRKALKHRSRLHKWAQRFKAADWEEAVEPLVGNPGLNEELADRDLLYRAFAKLTPRQRAVVELTYYFGYSYEEIARIIGCPENTVKTRMFHARARLKECLRNLGQRSADD